MLTLWMESYRKFLGVLNVSLAEEEHNLSSSARINKYNGVISSAAPIHPFPIYTTKAKALHQYQKYLSDLSMSCLRKP